MRPRGVKRLGRRVVITPEHFIISPKGTSDVFLLHYKDGNVRLEGKLPKLTHPKQTEVCQILPSSMEYTHVKPIEREIELNGKFHRAEKLLVDSFRACIADWRQNNKQRAS